ncbi:hypothetical protein D3C76_1330570 [compost metagenome]
MPGDVDDVIGAPHDVDKTIVVQVATVAGVVVTRVGCEVSIQVALVIAPQRLAATWRQWQGNDDGALLVGTEQLAVVVQYAHVVTRHCAVA